MPSRSVPQPVQQATNSMAAATQRRATWRAPHSTARHAARSPVTHGYDH